MKNELIFFRMSILLAVWVFLVFGVWVAVLRENGEEADAVFFLALIVPIACHLSFYCAKWCITGKIFPLEPRIRFTKHRIFITCYAVGILVVAYVGEYQRVFDKIIPGAIVGGIWGMVAFFVAMHRAKKIQRGKANKS